MSDSIRAALERLIELRSTDTHALLGLDWHEAFAAARLALAKRDPLRKHCTEILQLWDADCDIDGAMEHLRGLLSEEVQP